MYSRCNLFLDTGFANILSWSAASLFVLLTECLRRLRTPLLLGRVFSRCRFGLAGEASPSPPVSSLTFLRLFCRSPRGAAEVHEHRCGSVHFSSRFPPLFASPTLQRDGLVRTLRTVMSSRRIDPFISLQWPLFEVSFI